MEEDARSVAGKLVGLSRQDWKYSDLYLRQAETAVAPLCKREDFQRLVAERDLVGTLATDVWRAVERGDWSKAEQLSGEGGALRDRVERDGRLLSLAQAIYGERSLAVSPTSLALTGVVAMPARELAREISRLAGDLRWLAARGASPRELYERRAAELDGLAVDLPENPPAFVDPAELREAALAAAGEADFRAVQRIARGAASGGRDRLGRVRAPRPSPGVRRLADPIPEPAVARAREAGLECATLEADEGFNAYLSCRCADQAALPEHPLSSERREAESCTCGHACPPGMGPALKSSLDALMVHPFLTSGGTRYLPWFGKEVVLVETFPEDDPDARTPLLESLSIPGRRGLSRLAIEHALLSHGPRACEELGLDPTGYRVTCIPFDVYQRLAGSRGWGLRAQWTHFDGYQLTRELHLQALVGGDVRFGGPDDLCGLGRSYGSEHVTSRFAVLRRDRFEARGPRSDA